MIVRLWNGLRAWDRRARRGFDGDLSSPGARRRAFVFFHIFDHAFLRYFWTNWDVVGPGVYRSNQPGPRRVQSWADRGIKSILTLRGPSSQAFFALERDAAERAGLKLESVRMNARAASRKSEFLKLFEHFRTLEGPWVMHCKSGADRAGLASALHVLWQGGSVEDARKHLSWRYMHLDNKNTGICDFILSQYAQASEATGIDVETWFAEQYDQKAIQLAYDRKVGRRA